MITANPYGLAHIIRPGQLPEPLKFVHTCDPQDAIDRCLNCDKEKCRGSCVPEGSARYTGERMDVKRQKLRDEQIRGMILDGQSDREIRAKLGIAKSTLYYAKQRLRERGEIN